MMEAIHMQQRKKAMFVLFAKGITFVFIGSFFYREIKLITLFF
jgi:hypothetical protein